MRTDRLRTTALAATALVAALSLTACGGSDGTASSSASSSPAATSPGATEPTAPQLPKTAAPPAGAPAEKASTPAQGEHAVAERTAPASAAPRTACTTANTTVTVSRVNRPINHLLLTLRNTGSGLCDAYHAPHLRFDDAQSVFPVLGSSKPQAVITLAPGEEAYAGIGLTGEPGQGKVHQGRNLSVYFSERDGSTHDTPARLKLPAETFWDDNGFVTYWQSDRATALTF